MESMIVFWLGFLVIPLIYSMYQVSKKRLHDMGYSARPFWMFLFFLIFLMVGCFIYFGAGEHLNEVYNLREKVEAGVMSEKEMEELIRAREPVFTAKLEANRDRAATIMGIPTVLFILWLAITPGKKKQT